MRKKLVSLATIAALTMALLAVASPASGTVHEITGMRCSGGNAVFNPPGVTGGSNADNFAQPLFASGFASFNPTGGPGGDALISFDENHPASKITLTGGLTEIEPGVWLTNFAFNQGNWQNCL